MLAKLLGCILKLDDPQADIQHRFAAFQNRTPAHVRPVARAAGRASALPSRWLQKRIDNLVAAAVAELPLPAGVDYARIFRCYAMAIYDLLA